MPEAPGRFVIYGASPPTAGAYALLFTVPDPPAVDRYIYGIDVCNGGDPAHVGGHDAHVSIYIIPYEAGAWGGGEPPPLSRVVYNQLVECDATDGNVWVMPVKHLNPGDRVVVFADQANVTFYGHGFRYIPDTPVTP